MKQLLNKGLMILITILVLVVLFYIIKIIVNNVAKKENRSSKSIVVTMLEQVFKPSKNGTQPTTFWYADALLNGKLFKTQGIAWDEFQGNKCYTFGRKSSCNYVINHPSVSLNAIDLYCDSEQNFVIQPYNDSSVVRYPGENGVKYGLPVREKIVIEEGTTVYLGDIQLIFHRVKDNFTPYTNDEDVIKSANGTIIHNHKASVKSTADDILEV